MQSDQIKDGYILHKGGEINYIGRINAIDFEI